MDSSFIIVILILHKMILIGYKMDMAVQKCVRMHSSVSGL